MDRSKLSPTLCFPICAPLFSTRSLICSSMPSNIPTHKCRIDYSHGFTRQAMWIGEISTPLCVFLYVFPYSLLTLHCAPLCRQVESKSDKFWDCDVVVQHLHQRGICIDCTMGRLRSKFLGIFGGEEMGRNNLWILFFFFWSSKMKVFHLSLLDLDLYANSLS